VAEPRNHLHLTAEVAAPPDQVFDYFTNEFDEIWQGKMEHVRQGHDPGEPMGHGFVRRMHTPAGVLDEEIVTHERPRLIEYKVLEDGEPKFHNHLGRIEFTGTTGGGTSVDYTVRYDYRPPWQGPIVAAAMRLGWALRGRRRLAQRFRG
jgi:uncharacterized protein YndB with AHSA1/START domain